MKKYISTNDLRSLDGTRRRQPRAGVSALKYRIGPSGRGMTCAIVQRRRYLGALALAGAWCASLSAQEFYALAGGQYTRSLGEDSYSFSYEYLQNLRDHAFVTFTWLNEGHVSDHHRDGYSGQIWLRWLSDSRRFALSAGVGPYRYYDTTYVTPGGAVTDAHDWGVLGSVAAHWYARTPWVLQLRYNYARTTTSISTDTLLLGVGYQFEGSTRPGPVVTAGTYGFTSPERLEVTAMLGNSIVNNFHSPHGVAYAVELRARLTPYIDAIGTLLDEGDTHVVKRKGAAGQLGLAREFLNHRADVGVAGGFYLANDRDEIGSRTRVLGLMSMTMTYHWSSRWHTRLYWDRTLTTDGRDTDVVLLGLGHAY